MPPLSCLGSAKQAFVAGTVAEGCRNALRVRFAYCQLQPALKRRPVILVGLIASRWILTPGASGWGVPPRAVQETSSSAVVASIATPCTITLQRMSGEVLARLEGRHRAAGGNALRAAVLGVNDGLVSNLSLIMGVAGASLQQTTILLTGLAGLLAGAISMALGEWLSVQSSRELYARQIAIEKEELEAAPAEELEELTLIYQAKGVPRERASELATSIIASPRTALDTLAREELGIDPGGLGGSAWVAAGTSFALFAAGAVVPLLPYMFIGGPAAVGLSGVLAALGLFASGALGSFFTGQPVLRSALRQAGFGLAAAGVTFVLGKLVGTGLGL